MLCIVLNYYIVLNYHSKTKNFLYMKHILAGALLVATLCVTGCDEGSYNMYNDGDGKTTISINDETGRLKLETRGTITFTDDETGIKTISDGGYVRFKKNGNKIYAQSNAAGDVLYSVNDGPAAKVLSDNDSRILARAIKEMVNIGYDAKNRVARIYTRSGSAGVLNAIQDITNDWVKRQYFEYLVNDSKLTNDEMVTVAERIGEDLSSDYEKSNLLKKISASYLDNEQTTTAYLHAVKTIGSDFEKAGALKNVVDQPLTPGQYAQTLDIINDIGSDFEKAGVLKQLISHGTPDENNMNSFLVTTDGIGSEFEKAGVLKDVVKQGVPPGNSFNKFLDVTDGIQSDFEKANVLKDVAKANVMSDAQWVALIKATEKVNSDNEKSGAMIEVSKRMPKSEIVRSAYMLSAKSITSDYEYGQAIKAVN